VERSFTGWPDRIYVVDKDGRVAYKSAAGPYGFRPAEAEDRLRELLVSQ
jgi:type I thyroxine 5'-deiodinase